MKPELCIHEIFQNQSQIIPNKIALFSEGGDLTYQRANFLADQVAVHLRSQGIRTEELVGLCAECSPNAIVAVLGILKAGAACIPLDTEHPTERLREIGHEARIRIILSDARNKMRLASLRIPVFDLEEVLRAVAVKEMNFHCGTIPDGAAYVIYTSGSSGRPKGVVLTHRSIINGLSAVPFEGTPDEVCSLNTPLSSGFSLSRMFLPLLSGVPLLVVPDKKARDPQQFLRDAAKAKVTSMAIVTPMLRRIISDNPKSLSEMMTVRTLALGGAMISADLIESLRLAMPQATLLNGYGATEIGGAAIVWTTTAANGTKTCVFPNTGLYVLDTNGELVREGATGELYVGARHLARGYLNQPALTAERFLPDPFGNSMGGRLYRTGDLARWVSNEEIELMGRVDDQIKVRGYRVELGEIEAKIQAHPQVSAAAVVGVNQDSDLSLVAYVVFANAGGLLWSELRTYLRERLPDHMVPGRYVELGTLPLTGTGKVDRKALSRRAERVPSIQEVEYTAPRSSVESMISEIWNDALAIPRIGIHDDFFSLGGTSLIAIRILGRISASLGHDITLQDLADHPTIAGLATRIEGLQDLGIRSTAVHLGVIPLAGRDTLLPVSLWQDARLQQELAATIRSIYPAQAQVSRALLLQGQLNERKLHFGLNRVLERHEVLRTGFLPSITLGPVSVDGWDPVSNFLLNSDVTPEISFRQVIHGTAAIELPTYDLQDLSNPGLDIEIRAIMSRLEERFDYSKPPLMRASLLKTGVTTHIFVVVMSHLVSDLTSIDILMKEVFLSYASTRARLSSLPIQYADFAVWQRSRITPQYLKEVRARYGESSECDAVASSDLPLARREQGMFHTQAERESIVVPTVRMSGKSRSATVFQLLFAGFSILLHFYSQKAIIGIPTILANRTRPEVENLIGWFASTQALCVDFSGNPSVRNVLDQVTNSLSNATSRQEVMVFKGAGSKQTLKTWASHCCIFEFLPPLVEAGEVSGISFTRYPLPPARTALAAMRILVTESAPNVLTITLEYCIDCFSQNAARAMLTNLERIVEAMRSFPERRVKDMVP